MSVKASVLLEYGKQRLEEAGIFHADYDSRVLFQWICHLSHMDLLMNPDLSIEEQDASCYKEYIEKRSCHEPLQYLMGECEFMGLTFLVNPDVLIPRQDTETLVEWILERERDRAGDCTLLDLCTGSGCIPISISALWNQGTGRTTKNRKLLVEALDLSEKALDVARENAKRNQVSIHFFKSNMFERVEKKYDILVSNPPYIPSKEIDHLMEEVKDFEPRMALDGEEDGLSFYRILASESGKYLNPGGRLYLEIGHDQGQTVPRLLHEAGFSNIEIKKDLAGLSRAVAAVFSPETNSFH